MPLPVFRSDITEMRCGTNFALVLTESAAFSPTEYKVMQSQTADSCVRCMKMLYNGKTELYYLVENRYSLDYLLPSLTGDAFLQVVAYTLKNCISIKNNGFLSCMNVYLSLEKIFVDKTTLRVSLVYAPLNTKLFREYGEFENYLRTSLRNAIRNNANLACSRVNQFANDLANPNISLEELYKRLGIAGGGSGPEPAPNRSGVLQLTALRENCVLRVDRDPYIIGKDPNKVQGLVTFNRFISSVHCSINRVNGQYFVTDVGKDGNGTPNHTYLNGEQLQPRKAYPLKQGDTLRLANSDFAVSFAEGGRRG